MACLVTNKAELSRDLSPSFPWSPSPVKAAEPQQCVAVRSLQLVDGGPRHKAGCAQAGVAGRDSGAQLGAFSPQGRLSRAWLLMGPISSLL